MLLTFLWIKMPRKDREEYNAYMRKYLKGWRAKEKARNIALKKRLEQLDIPFHNRLFPKKKGKK